MKKERERMLNEEQIMRKRESGREKSFSLFHSSLLFLSLIFRFSLFFSHFQFFSLFLSSSVFYSLNQLVTHFKVKTVIAVLCCAFLHKKLKINVYKILVNDPLIESQASERSNNWIMHGHAKWWARERVYGIEKRLLTIRNVQQRTSFSVFNNGRAICLFSILGESVLMCLFYIRSFAYGQHCREFHAKRERERKEDSTVN